MTWKKQSTIVIIAMFLIMNSSGCIDVFKDKSDKKITAKEAYDLLQEKVDTNDLMLVNIESEGINNNGLAGSWSFTFRENVNGSFEYVCWKLYSNSTIIEEIPYAIYDIYHIYKIGLDSDVLVKKSRESDVYKNFSKGSYRLNLVRLIYYPGEKDGDTNVLMTYERYFLFLPLVGQIYLYYNSKNGEIIYYE